MKAKAYRASLAGVVTAALVISLLPSYAYTQAQTQGAGGPRQRRGKNGEPTVKPSDGQETPQQERSSSATKPGPPQTSASNVGKPDDQSAGTADRASHPAERTAQPNTSQKADEAQSTRGAPPFDRPPLGQPSGGADGTGRKSSQAPPASQQDPVYSGSDSQPRARSGDRASDRDRASSSPRDRSADSSSGEVVDTDRSGRTGERPVLRRPADSRGRDDGGDVGKRDSSPGSQPASGDDVIKLESTLVDIPLLVSDRSGRYVPQLTARDFEIYEDGVQQKIASFGSEEVPFNVALLLDVSPSVQGSEQDIQDAALAFVRQLRDQDRVMVVAFDRRIHYLSDFTSDRRQLEWAIRQARTGQGTSVYDAVYEVVARRLRGIDGRKAMILFSDGEDTTSSHADYNDAVEIVSESDVLVYGLRYPGSGGGRIRVDPWPRNVPRVPIPLPWPWPTPGRRRWPFPFFNLTAPSGVPGATPTAPQSRSRRGGDFMADVTAAGGGPVYDAERISDLSRLANRIAEELRHVYVISYYPSNPLSNGGYRSVRVAVPGRADLAIRHRKGYNARPTGNAKPTI